MTKFKWYYVASVSFLIFFSSSTYAQIEELTFAPQTELQKKETQKDNKQEPKKTRSSKDDLIHIGDLIEVDIQGSTEYDWRGKISNEGFLDGIEFTDDEILGLCKTGKQIAAEIAKSYRKFLRSPKINVTILDRSNRPTITLFGAVRKPQKFKLKRKVYLNELIVLSGGFTERASGVIQVLRQPHYNCVDTDDLTDTETVDIKTAKFIKTKEDKSAKFIDIKIADLLNGNDDSNIQILYGDVITVKTAEPIYVIGGVVKPSKLQIRESTTVSKAIASAGGLTDSANLENVKIFRREDQRTNIIEINLKAIADGDENDVKLKAYDIVDVSEKGRNEKKYPPIINYTNFKDINLSRLPITVID